MRVRRPAACSALLVCTLAIGPSVIHAQVVRGRVTQETSAAPVAGALIELLFADSADARAASVLSDPSGGYELRAPGSGRYRISAKRIGVRRYTGAPFMLGAGESRTEAIVLAGVDFRLPEIVVTANTLCSVNPGERARVTALWDEARTALDATEISLRDKLFSAEVTRYIRDLDPKTMRVLDETQSSVRGVMASPFNAISADSLSVVGYWREIPGGGVRYYGPDAPVLLSEAFLDDHCFHPVEGRGERKGYVGLAFAPVAGRTVPEVLGTLWLDARTFELRLVEFRYDRVRDGIDGTALGGELHFARLPNGAWVVQRWFLRVPVFGRSEQPLATEGSAPWILVRPSSFRLREEGGTALTDDMRVPAKPASIAGVVRDSSAQGALAGAVVRLGGSSRTAVTDSLGRFGFDGVRPGPVALVVHSPGYDALGLAAADASLQLAEGDARRVVLTAHDTRTLTLRLCDGEAAALGRGTLLGTVRDAASGTPIAGARATVQWMSTIGQEPGDSIPQRVTETSDERGRVTFCQVPSGRRLSVEVVRTDGGTPYRFATAIDARAVRHLDLPIDRDTPNE